VAAPWSHRIWPRAQELTGEERLLLPLCADLGIDVDAAPDGRHGDDQTPYDLAVLNGNTEIADLLAAAGARTRPLEPDGELVAARVSRSRPATTETQYSGVTKAKNAAPSAIGWPVCGRDCRAR
jgi:hypothetical protein